jgi:hypothetical protein
MLLLLFSLFQQQKLMCVHQCCSFSCTPILWKLAVPVNNNPLSHFCIKHSSKTKKSKQEHFLHLIILWTVDGSQYVCQFRISPHPLICTSVTWQVFPSGLCSFTAPHGGTGTSMSKPCRVCCHICCCPKGQEKTQDQIQGPVQEKMTQGMEVL